MKFVCMVKDDSFAKLLVRLSLGNVNMYEVRDMLSDLREGLGL